MSVNSTNKEMWNQLLSLYVDDQQADEISDAILDWRDEDDLHRLNGVESDYYLGLNPAYPARNGPFFSVEELLLVRGITEEMFYGTWDKPGLIEVLDTGSQNLSRFDINTCPKGVLMAFLEMSSEDADELIRVRGEQYFDNMMDAANVVNIPNQENLTQYFMSFRGSTFTVKATAFVNEARYTVETLVSYKGGGSFYRTMAHKDFSLDHVDEMIIEEEEE